MTIAVGNSLVNPRLALKKLLAEAAEMGRSFDSRNK
jgi:hypothetical protein